MTRMRDVLGFLVFGLIVFFVVGETVGWNVGVAGQTPVWVYKRDGTASAQRRTITRGDMPVEVEGRVRDGQVDVTVVFEDRGSFQTNRAPDPASVVFEESFRSGQRIAIDEVFEEGRGSYLVELRFHGATGVFRVRMPTGTEL
jgi:hypothetical protein